VANGIADSKSYLKNTMAGVKKGITTIEVSEKLKPKSQISTLVNKVNEVEKMQKVIMLKVILKYIKLLHNDSCEKSSNFLRATNY